MTKAQIEEMSNEMITITEEWAARKNISKYNTLIRKRIEELNRYIFSISPEESISETNCLIIKLCHQFYVLKDQSENQ